MKVGILATLVASSLAATCLNDKVDRSKDVVPIIQISNGLSNGTFKVSLASGNITFPDNCNFNLEKLKLNFDSAVEDDPLITIFGTNPGWSYGRPMTDQYLTYTIQKKGKRYVGSVGAADSTQLMPLTHQGEEIGGFDFSEADVFIVFSERWQVQIATGTYNNGWARVNRQSPTTKTSSQIQETTPPVKSSAASFYLSWFAAIAAVGILA